MVMTFCIDPTEFWLELEVLTKVEFYLLRLSCSDELFKGSLECCRKQSLDKIFRNGHLPSLATPMRVMFQNVHFLRLLSLMTETVF